jgi:hypothetical protein
MLKHLLATAFALAGIIGDCEKSFLELPDAKQFLRIRGERVFQQPPLFSTVIQNLRRAVESSTNK